MSKKKKTKGKKSKKISQGEGLSSDSQNLQDVNSIDSESDSELPKENNQDTIPSNPATIEMGIPIPFDDFQQLKHEARQIYSSEEE